MQELRDVDIWFEHNNSFNLKQNSVDEYPLIPARFEYCERSIPRLSLSGTSLAEIQKENVNEQRMMPPSFGMRYLFWGKGYFTHLSFAHPVYTTVTLDMWQNWNSQYEFIAKGSEKS